MLSGSLTRRPRWQHHVAHRISVLLSAQIQIQFVLQEVGVAPEELWDQLHDGGETSLAENEEHRGSSQAAEESLKPRGDGGGFIQN